MNTAKFPRNPRRDDDDPHATALAQVTNEHAKDVITSLGNNPSWVLPNMLRAWGLYFPWDDEFEDAPVVQAAIRAEIKRRKQPKKSEA